MLSRSMLPGLVFIPVLLAMILSMSGCGEEPTPESPEAIIQKGWTSFAAEDYEDAKAKFDEALTSEEITPAVSADAYVGLGWANGRMLDRQGSIASFQSALSEDPQNADAHAGIAFAYLADDKYDDAIASANQALALEPDYSFDNVGVTSCELRIVLAESYYYKGDFEEAAKILELPEGTEPAELLKELEKASGGC